MTETFRLTKLPANVSAARRALQQALRQGARHYDRGGRELATAEEILTCICREGGVTVQPPKEKA